MTSIAEKPAPIAIEFRVSYATAVQLALEDTTVSADERAAGRDGRSFRVVVPAGFGRSGRGAVEASFQEENELGEKAWTRLTNRAAVVIGGLVLDADRIIALAFQALVVGLDLERTVVAHHSFVLSARAVTGALILNLGTV